LKLVHPFMPFISEELWHDELFGPRAEDDCCIVAEYPRGGEFDEQLLTAFSAFQQAVSEIRNLRNTKQLSPKTALPLTIHVTSDINFAQYTESIQKIANISTVEIVTDKPSGVASFLVGKDEFFVDVAQNVDVEAERQRITKEITYLEGFLKSVDAKLANERFVMNAKPEIVANEKNKKADD